MGNSDSDWDNVAAVIVIIVVAILFLIVFASTYWCGPCTGSTKMSTFCDLTTNQLWLRIAALIALTLVAVIALICSACGNNSKCDYSGLVVWVLIIIIFFILL